MDFKFPYKDFKPDDLIQRCGYSKIINNKTGQTSFARRLHQELYPRFHVYLKNSEKYFEVSLHLDQKKTSYQGQKAHSGEYDGPLVEQEAKRITAVIKKIYQM